MDARASVDGIFPERFWTYLTSEVMPKARDTVRPFESAHTKEISAEITTPTTDAATLGRLLDYIDFQFRWALSIEPLLGEDTAYARAIGFPFRICPANFKDGMFQVVSIEVGSLRTKLLATSEATTVLMGALASVAVTFTAVTGMSPSEFFVERPGQSTSVQAPAPPEPGKDQVDPFCFSPAPFEITVDINLSDGESVRVIAKVPAGNPVNTDSIYAESMRTAAIARAD